MDIAELRLQLLKLAVEIDAWEDPVVVAADWEDYVLNGYQKPNEPKPKTDPVGLWSPEKPSLVDGRLEEELKRIDEASRPLPSGGQTKEFGPRPRISTSQPRHGRDSYFDEQGGESDGETYDAISEAIDFVKKKAAFPWVNAPFVRVIVETLVEGGWRKPE